MFSTNRLRIIVSIILIVHCGLMFKCGAARTIMGDDCDWTGSGLTTADEARGVTPLYLRCAAGRVTWLYPRGALRVLLRLPSGREFRACVRLNGHARAFLEGRVLHALRTRDGKAIRCFQSKNGQAALYVEATEWQGLERRVAELQYDLQTLPRGDRGYDPVEECRPCTDEEMAHAFCTSDFVARGIIRNMENSVEEEISKMTVKVTKMIRYMSVDGYDWTNSTDSQSNTDRENNLVEELDPILGVPIRAVQLVIPSTCGASRGVGEFVFMARRKLGDLSLQCAPRLEDWVEIMRSINEQGKAHCILRS